MRQRSRQPSALPTPPPASPAPASTIASGGCLSGAATFEVFLVAPPGLEVSLAREAAAAGFAPARPVAGGVLLAGDWREVWRANLVLRGAVRVLARIASFRALHPAQLDKRCRRVDWAGLFAPGLPLRVEAACTASRIYHEGAARSRLEAAIADTAQAVITPDAAVRVLLRLEDDLCTLSLDTSGEALFKRGSKQAVGKAPLRESLAALFLAEAGFDGIMPVVDPMCGSGTFPIEAAEIAHGLLPGRSRGFAFQLLAGFDHAAYSRLRADLGLAPHAATDRAAEDCPPQTAAEARGAGAGQPAAGRGAADPALRPGAGDQPPAGETPSAPVRPAASAHAPAAGVRFFGFDRDAGAVRMAQANAARAGVAGSCHFACQPVGALQPPVAPGLAGPGLVILNPPYGTRIGERKMLFALYAATGAVLRARFSGWRVAMVCPDPGLAAATGLPFLPDPLIVDHGGLKVRLWRTAPLA